MLCNPEGRRTPEGAPDAGGGRRTRRRRRTPEAGIGGKSRSRSSTSVLSVLPHQTCLPSDTKTRAAGRVFAQADPAVSARWNFSPIGASNGAALTSDGLSI